MILGIIFYLIPLSLFGNITKIHSMQEVAWDAPLSSLYFFDIDDTLIDSPYMLGSKEWRKYINENAPDLHDEITYYVAKYYPVDFIEESTPRLIETLQQKGYGVFGLTARERNIWYYTPKEGVDGLTIAQLEMAEIF